MKKIKYVKGEILGNNIEYVEEAGWNIQPSGKKERKAKFKCHCGNEFNAIISNVKKNHTTSCGCLQGLGGSLSPSYKHGNSKEGGKHYYIWILWCAIKSRCYNEKNHAYKDYGGRGIKMCEVFRGDYLAFKSYILEFLGERPTPIHSLDRIGNDGDYVQGNLRWATKKTQRINSRPIKLTKEDALEIKWLLSTGLFLQKDIATDYNVTPSTIGDIKIGRSHKDVQL